MTTMEYGMLVGDGAVAKSFGDWPVRLSMPMTRLLWPMCIDSEGRSGSEVYCLDTVEFFGETVPLRDDRGRLTYRYRGMEWAQPTP